MASSIYQVCFKTDNFVSQPINLSNDIGTSTSYFLFSIFFNITMDCVVVFVLLLYSRWSSNKLNNFCPGFSYKNLCFASLE